MRARRAWRWAGYGAFAIVFAIACGFLANWQFERGAERNAQLDLIARNYDAEPIPLDQVVGTGDSVAAGDVWRPVVLTGTYLTADQVLARNRAQGGTSAFEVLVPFQLTDGRVIIVDRGWVPPGESQPEPDAIPAAPAGEVTVIARLQASEPLPRSGRSAPPGQVPTINVESIADAAGLPTTVLGGYALMVSEDPAPADRPSELPDPSSDPGPHLSYAIQWILFAIMGFGFIWYAIRTERRAQREEEAGIAPTVRRRKVDRDMQEEDALLDRVP